MKFNELEEGDRCRFVNAAMFNSGEWVVTTPIISGSMTGVATQGHNDLITRADREVEKVEDA